MKVNDFLWEQIKERLELIEETWADELKHEVDRLTQLLFEWCHCYEEMAEQIGNKYPGHLVIPMPTSVQKWWEQHKRACNDYVAPQSRDKLSRDEIATKLDAIQSSFDAIYERLSHLEKEDRKRRDNAQANLDFMNGKRT